MFVLAKSKDQLEDMDQTCFYSRPLKITGTNFTSQKKTKKDWACSVLQNTILLTEQFLSSFESYQNPKSEANLYQPVGDGMSI